MRLLATLILATVGRRPGARRGFDAVPIVSVATTGQNHLEKIFLGVIQSLRSQNRWIWRTAFWHQTIDFPVRRRIAEKSPGWCVWAGITSEIMFLIVLHNWYDLRNNLRAVLSGITSVWSWDPTSDSHPTIGLEMKPTDSCRSVAGSSLESVGCSSSGGRKKDLAIS